MRIKVIHQAGSNTGFSSICLMGIEVCNLLVYQLWTSVDRVGLWRIYSSISSSFRKMKRAPGHQCKNRWSGALHFRSILYLFWCPPSERLLQHSFPAACCCLAFFSRDRWCYKCRDKWGERSIRQGYISLAFLMENPIIVFRRVLTWKQVVSELSVD